MRVDFAQKVSGWSTQYLCIDGYNATKSWKQALSGGFFARFGTEVECISAGKKHKYANFAFLRAAAYTPAQLSQKRDFLAHCILL